MNENFVHHQIELKCFFSHKIKSEKKESIFSKFHFLPILKLEYRQRERDRGTGQGTYSDVLNFF